MPEGRLERLGLVLFDALLRLLPGGLRRDAGGDMLATFRARQSDAAPRGAPAVLRLWLRELGGLASTAVRARLRRPTTPRNDGAALVDTLAQDLRFVLRSLRRSPAFTATALVVIAVGVGATTAIFSAVDAVLLRPLPFHDPDRLVMLWEHNPEKGWVQETAAPANALDWRERVEAFEDVALYDGFTGGLTLVGENGAEQLRYATVSGNFFDVLGVRPALGEDFTWEDTWEGGISPVVLAWDTWRSRFGGDPGAVGRVVDFAGEEARIVGVMPPGFTFPHEGTELWTPYGWAPSSREEVWFRRAHWVSPVARLRPGVTFQEADAQLQAVAASLMKEFPETNATMGAGMSPLQGFLAGDRRSPLLVLLGAVGLLLLIACANVGNLLLVRAQGRAKELAVRRAMGAGARRLARLVLLESVVLAAVGGALGVVAGGWGLRALDGMRSLTLPGVAGLVLDARVALFSLAVVAGCALLFGLPPALRAGRADPSGSLAEDGRGGRGRGAARAIHALVVTEVAVALLLVVAAGLMVRSFLRLRSVDPGVRVEDVMTFRVVVPGTRYPSRDEALAFLDELDRRLEALPDVASAAYARILSPGRTGWSSDFSESTWPPERAGREILHREVSADYFDVLDVPVLAGRAFDAGDGAASSPVVVVNRAFVREHFPGEEVVGRRIAFDAVPRDESVWRTIVGVVGDERQEALAAPPRAEVFAPLAQDFTRGVAVVLRTRAGAPASVMPAARGVLGELDPLMPAVEARTMADIVAEALARDRFLLVLVGVFGLAALVLAAVGIYGVVAQSTRRRTREIGIRMALGARAGDVRSMVLVQGMALVGVGLAVGLAAALAGARVLRSLLFEVAPTDPLTFVAVPALLAGVALVACWLPARRATRVDPVGSLRAE